MSMCNVAGCARDVIAKGFCTMHYARFKKHGSPLVLSIAPKGSGSRRKDGYLAYRRNGVETLEHREIAEKAMGKQLPYHAEVHHVDADRTNSINSNLVVCPNRAYHQLIHQRTRALDECGNAGWLKCVYCKKYDSPFVLTRYTNKNGSTNQYHDQCKRDSAKAYYHRNKGINHE